MRVNIAEAKARLSELIEVARQGEEVLIARRNTPVAKLMPVRSRADGPRFGACEGRVWMSPDFDEPLKEFADYTAKGRPRRKPGRGR
jgi:prevent-host-death family protein